jgi:CubicO group peptidase (beta-lactamase class C family)
MLGRRLAFAPGAQAVYSNFGFVVLGEIVRERAGAASYAEATWALTLLPTGAAGVRAEAGAPDYLPGQAVGYSVRSGRRVAGGGPPMRLAAGGWVGSPLDMTRFLMALGGSAGERLLSKPSYEAMLARPASSRVRPNDTWFGLGWDVVRLGPTGPSYEKNGGLEGVATRFGHEAPDVEWAIFLNRGPDRSRQGADARKAVGDALRAEIARRKAWPSEDYWSRYPAP